MAEGARQVVHRRRPRLRLQNVHLAETMLRLVAEDYAKPGTIEEIFGHTGDAHEAPIERKMLRFLNQLGELSMPPRSVCHFVIYPRHLSWHFPYPFSPAHIDFQALLDDEEGAVVRQRSPWMHQLDIECPQDLNQHFVHLKQCKVSPNTEMAASAKLLVPSRYCQ